jgi:WD40 repeat protein
VREDQKGTVEASGSVSTVPLTPPLRMDIDRLRFSRDGKYLLAQDESSIYVLTREPFKELFRIDAEDALPSDFTPDSQQLAFYTPALHVERWSVAQQKLLVAHEMVLKKPCLDTLLAPDGRTLGCVLMSEAEGMLDFALFDVETGAEVFLKKQWFSPSYLFAVLMFAHESAGVAGTDFMPYAVSEDGNTLLIGGGSYKLAFDLRNRTQIKIGGAVNGEEITSSYAFQGNDRIVGVNTSNQKKSGVYSFPDGKRIKDFPLGLGLLKSTTKSDLLVAPGPQDFASALVDVDSGKYVFGTRSPGLDVFGTSVVSQYPDGSVVLETLHSKDPKDSVKMVLPLSPLAGTRVVAMSRDGRYLALSSRSRGSVWDLKTGEQMYTVRGFEGAWWSPEGKLMAEFPKTEQKKAAIVEMDMSPKGSKAGTYELDGKAHLNSGHLVEWKWEGKKAIVLNAHSLADNSVVWTRHFDEGRPGWTTNIGNDDLILDYPIVWAMGKEKLRTDAALKEEANSVKDKNAGRLVEVVNSADGSTRAQVVVEVPLSFDGTYGFNRVGDLLYLNAGDNRVIVYSMKTGAQLRQTFGNVISIDQASETVCILNRRDEAIVMDRNGIELAHLKLESPVRFARVREQGTELDVLTADQTLRRFKVGGGTAGASSAAR